MLVNATEHGRDPYGRTWGLLAPTYAQVLQLQRTAVQMANNAGMLDSATYSPPVPSLTLTTGGKIECRSWDRPDNIRGWTLLGGAADEFGMLTADAYRNITARRAETITHGLGRIIWIGNVGVIGGEAERLWNLAEAGSAGFESMRWTWRDRAEALPCVCGAPNEYTAGDRHELECRRGIYLRFIAVEAARLPSARFRADYEAEWLDAADLPVYEFDRQVHVSAEHAAYQAELPVEISCDFNVDPMVWALGQSRRDMAWDFGEIRIDGQATTQAACNEVIRRFPDTKTEIEVYGDRSGKSRDTRSKITDYEIIRKVLGGYYLRFRMDVPNANPPVQARVDAVNAKLAPMIGDPTYYVHPDCETIIRDRVRVSWKPGTRDIDKSNRNLTHGSDASDYRIVAKFPITPAGPISVGLPGFGEQMADSIGTMEF